MTWVIGLLIGALAGSLVTDGLWRIKWTRDLRKFERQITQLEESTAYLRELYELPGRLGLFDPSLSPVDAAERACARPRLVPPRAPGRWSS